MDRFPYVSIVVIGYNEASNLNNTFSAIQNMNYPLEKIEIIYVDSDSSDGSVDIARKYTNKIFIEDRYPSPGRNRNRGLVEAKYDIVHFIDGDVIIDSVYLRNIVHLFEEKNVHAVVGQLDEQRPNIYNIMAALSNVEKEEGYAQFTSTGATYLKFALMSVNGYDERIRRGQESELGERFRKAGYKIWCTRHKMGSHNFGVQNLWQYIQKDKINARSLVHISFIEGNSDYITSARSRLNRQFVKPVMFVLFLAISIISMNFYYVLTYWVVIWGMKNRSIVRQKFVSKPALVSLRCIIDFFFLWIWWYGVISGISNYYFRRKDREYYHLRKTVLNGD
jgi:glycosyltransferase involved in cell wall biosynthesis